MTSGLPATLRRFLKARTRARREPSATPPKGPEQPGPQKAPKPAPAKRRSAVPVPSGAPPSPPDPGKGKASVGQAPADPGAGGMGYGGQRGFGEGTVRYWRIGNQMVPMRKVSGKWVPVTTSVRKRLDPEDPTNQKKSKLVRSPVHHGGVANTKDMVVGAEYAIPLKDDDGNEFRAMAKIVRADEETLTLQVEDDEGNPIPGSIQQMTRQDLAGRMLNLHKQEYRKKAKRLAQEVQDVRQYGTSKQKKQIRGEAEEAGLTVATEKAPFVYDAAQKPNLYGLNRSAIRLQTVRDPEDPDRKLHTMDSAIGDLVALGFYDALMGPTGDTELLGHLAKNQGRDITEMDYTDLANAAKVEARMAAWWSNLDDGERDLFAANYCDYDAQKYNDEADSETGKKKKGPVRGLDEAIHNDTDIDLPRGMEKAKEIGWSPHDIQRKATAFATRHAKDHHAVLGMDMGLGKTATTVMIYHEHKAAKRVDKCIITCPLSAVESWRNEWSKLSNAKVGFLSDHDRKGRRELFAAFKNGDIDVLVMTPETMAIHKKDIKGVMDNPRRIMRVGDEVHLYKTPGAKRTKAFRDLLGGGKPGPVIGLTGTLKPNKAKDMYHIFDAVHPDAIGGDEGMFHERYCHRIYDEMTNKSYIAFREGSVKRLQRDLGSHLFMRSADDPDSTVVLPPRVDLAPRLTADPHQVLSQRLLVHYHKLRALASGLDPRPSKKSPGARPPKSLKRKLKLRKVRLDATSQLGGSAEFAGSLQKIMEEYGAKKDGKKRAQVSEEKMKEAQEELQAAQNGERGGKYAKLHAAIAKIAPKSPITLLQRLHMASVDPRLLGDEVHAALPEGYRSTKMNFCAHTAMQHLQNHPDKGAVIFGTYTKSLEHMRDALIARGVKKKEIAIIDGSTSPHRRRMIQLMLNQSAEERKQNPELYDRAKAEVGPIKYLIAQTKSMMTGANLQKRANLVLHMDTPHEPDALTQSTARVFRQGQKHTTFVVRPTTSEVEHMISANVHRKILESNKALGREMSADMFLRDSIERSARGEYTHEKVAEALGMPKSAFAQYMAEPGKEHEEVNRYMEDLARESEHLVPKDEDYKPSSKKESVKEELDRLRAELSRLRGGQAAA